MLNDIVKTWLTVLDPMLSSGLITTVYPLVRPGRISIANGRNFVMPVLVGEKEQAYETVNDGLLINDKKRAICFVKGDSTRTDKQGSTRQESLPVTLVLWYNKNGFETAGGNISAKFTAAVASLLEKPVSGLGLGYQSIQFNRTGFIEGWRCFQDYSFREETGYLFEPYQAVGIVGNLTFYVNKNENCQSDLLPVDFSSYC